MKSNKNITPMVPYKTICVLLIPLDSANPQAKKGKTPKIIAPNVPIMVDTLRFTTEVSVVHLSFGNNKLLNSPNIAVKKANPTLNTAVSSICKTGIFKAKPSTAMLMAATGNKTVRFTSIFAQKICPVVMGKLFAIQRVLPSKEIETQVVQEKVRNTPMTKGKKSTIILLSSGVFSDAAKASFPNTNMETVDKVIKMAPLEVLKK